jgi:flagellar biosynthesis protein FlhG
MAPDQDPPASPGPSVPLTVAVTSGKGGVGKSQLVASLAVVLVEEGIRTLLVDADVGCGNLDVLLGLRPPFDMRSVLSGERRAAEILCRAPFGHLCLDVLPAPAANRQGAELSPGEQLGLIDAVSDVGRDYDVVLVDTGAGVSRNPMLFGAAADRVIVVTTPEPTAIHDAYAAIKVLHQAHAISRFELVVNQAQGPQDGKQVYARLLAVIDEFLPVELGLLGVLPEDPRVPRAVRSREPVTFAYPTSTYAHAVRSLAHRLLHSPAPRRVAGQVRFFARAESDGSGP